MELTLTGSVAFLPTAATAAPAPARALAPGDTTLAALTAGYDVIRQPLGEILPRLSATLAELVPHLAAAELSTHCAHSPFKTAGDADFSARISAADLEPLFVAGVPGRPWQGTARIAGAERSVVAVMTDATPRGALLVLVRGDEATPVDASALAVTQALWSLVAAHFDRFASEATPGALARSRAAADTRARVMAELGETHSAALTGLLGVLRSRNLDDAAARATATELAVTALIELRAETDRDKAVAEERADEAFARLADALRPLLRHSPVRLELGAPDSARRVAADVAHAARAIVRAVLLTVLEQETMTRVHVGWQVTEQELRATVRDDGPGALSMCSLGPARISDRLDVLGGRLDVDAVPGWGTTVTAVIPLTTPDAPATAAGTDPLTSLGARELEVLTRLARGHRNRQIAQELHISESTVKFHVAKILTKLGVGSRGEAAALFHAAA
ncbi:LuxR C-terminal-related transcriptional regulator [Streptomyces sp. ISL-100]|uniref:helix-turn-helix transcriptional regulator n=1 Tax=Streptomyces sp. ISL-100 TaxID=2819173 RepID=UPI001BEC29BA|nr:LuxR C-terminal-related transcriptional regulator [Streptomyces sp. ISL-100]MBT2399462.1 helix-turn-helix transcriptional regulator [Streptomyces sp. ISL-100]